MLLNALRRTVPTASDSRGRWILLKRTAPICTHRTFMRVPPIKTITTVAVAVDAVLPRRRR